MIKCFLILGNEFVVIIIICVNIVVLQAQSTGQACQCPLKPTAHLTATRGSMAQLLHGTCGPRV